MVGEGWDFVVRVLGSHGMAGSREGIGQLWARRLEKKLGRRSRPREWVFVCLFEEERELLVTELANGGKGSGSSDPQPRAPSGNKEGTGRWSTVLTTGLITLE